MSAPIPLKVRIPKDFASSLITAIRIQDVARGIWYSWDKNTTYPNGYWDNAGGEGNNAPVGQTPMITPGANNLYVAFYAKNNYTYAVNMALYVYDSNNNILAQQVNVYTAAGASAGVEYTGTMPTGSYTLILYSAM
jgi:hypothetical protein